MSLLGVCPRFERYIVVARKILDHAPHTMLVGQGAELFAHVMGCEKGDLSTEISRKIYDTFVREALEYEIKDERHQNQYGAHDQRCKSDGVGLDFPGHQGKEGENP